MARALINVRNCVSVINGSYVYKVREIAKVSGCTPMPKSISGDQSISQLLCLPQTIKDISKYPLLGLHGCLAGLLAPVVDCICLLAPAAFVQLLLELVNSGFAFRSAAILG